MTFGYVRVSTRKQSLDQQLDALVAEGVPAENIFGDVRSGASWDREGLQALREHLREGDTLVVVALDRLGRSLSEVVALLGWLKERGVVLHSIRERIDFSTPTGAMMAAVFAAMAQYERELMLERAEAAREAARQRGRQSGRPRALDNAQRDQAKALLDSGWSRARVAEALAVSRATLYREFPVGASVELRPGVTK